ncbi:M28 family peptidase [Candidatus Zixiibacteriota bacterium]
MMKLRFNPRLISAVITAAIILPLIPTHHATAQTPPDRWLVPADIREAILQEFSGELALQHIQLLAANRIRPEEEYTQKFFETSYLEEMATRYGLSDVAVDYYPAGQTWVPYEADLWMVEPVRKKMASLTMVPSAVASGSRSADVETELVWVGMGRPADYEGIDVTGKIVLGSGSVSGAFSSGVNQRGAAGALGTGSAGVSGNYPGYTLDQIGWASVRPSEGIEGFGFNLSLRQHNELRGLLERGQRVVMRAHVKTATVPYRMNVISAAIEGTDPDAGELIKVAHAFERIATPGANDNCSGVATVLEIARTLQALIDRGTLPRPRRTIRFLFVPEISGSGAWMYDHPELEERIIAAMNYDMPGEDLELTDSWLRMKMTPDSHPSYLNDLIFNLLECTDQTDIRTQTGNNSPFNYRLVPFISSSDHIVFLRAGIPAMQFNHWTDNFYHSSGDRVEVSDPTEMKRSGFIGAASFFYLANAGEEEAIDLAWEASANGEKWLAEVTRQAIRLLDVEGEAIHERHKAAQNKITGAFNRAAGSVRSVLDLADTPEVHAMVDQLTESLGTIFHAHDAKLEAVYRQMCTDMGARPQRITLTDLEREYDRMVPRYKYQYYSEEYRAASSQVNQYVPSDHRLRGMASTIVPWSVDGERSILDIYNLARAEFGDVTTSSTEWKFAYAVTPGSGDVALEAVAGVILAMEQAGLVEIERK